MTPEDIHSLSFKVGIPVIMVLRHFWGKPEVLTSHDIKQPSFQALFGKSDRYLTLNISSSPKDHQIYKKLIALNMDSLLPGYERETIAQFE